MNACILEHLTVLYPTAERTLFAPPILDHAQDKMGYMTRTTAEAWFALESRAKNHVIDLGIFNGNGMLPSVPSLYTHHVQQYNKSLVNWALTAQAIRDATSMGENYRFVVQGLPFFWIPAHEIAAWLEEAQDTRAACWIEAEKRPAALARLCAWRACLHALRNADARVLFHYR